MSDQPPTTEGYQAKKVALGDMVNKDSDDAALSAYKASLLGGSLVDGKVVAAFPDNPNKVIVDSIEIILFDDSLPEDKRTFKLKVDQEDQKITIKEGTIFHVYVSFYVQHEIALGLKFLNSVSRLGFKNDDQSVLGSFAPSLTPHRVRATEHEAPSGLIGRGNYTGLASLFDDDGSYCNFKYSIEIGKEWKH